MKEDNNEMVTMRHYKNSKKNIPMQSTFEVSDSTDTIIVQGIENDCYESYSEHQNNNEVDFDLAGELVTTNFFEWCIAHYDYKYKPGFSSWMLSPIFGNENSKILNRTRDYKILATIHIEWGDITEEEKKECLELIDKAPYYKREAKLPEESEELDNKGYDESDIFTAFDGDIDSYNEFMGNH